MLPWGNHFALFATDASGVVSYAGCYMPSDPQSGLMGPGAPMSDSFTGVAGAPVTVLPWDDHFALFAIDATGSRRRPAERPDGTVGQRLGRFRRLAHRNRGCAPLVRGLCLVCR